MKICGGDSSGGLTVGYTDKISIDSLSALQNIIDRDTGNLYCEILSLHLSEFDTIQF